MTDVGTVIERGNVAVVTGGASGIGLAVAEQQAAGSPIGVSVLCPGFVKTDLMVSEPTAVNAPIAGVLAAGVDNGMPAAGVAGRLVEAVDARQFWILTHDDMAQIPVERMLRASTQTNPTALGAAAEPEVT